MPHKTHKEQSNACVITTYNAKFVRADVTKHNAIVLSSKYSMGMNAKPVF